MASDPSSAAAGGASLDLPEMDLAAMTPVGMDPLTGLDPEDLGPAKGLREPTLLSKDERLRGRPKLCSDCGLCDSQFKPLMASSCTFVRQHVPEIEQRLHGRERREGDELRFGIFRAMYGARMRQPASGAQWSGMVTSLGAALLETGQVEGVITAAAAPGTRFAPRPVLARTPDAVRASAGNKPCLSPNLALLDEVRAAGIKRLAFIGTGCQVQILRAAEPQLREQMGLEHLDVIGIPCSDNVTYPDLQFFLTQVSRSPETIVHYEFMQDYRLWMRHDDGDIERVNFIDFPMDKLDGVFPSACLSCFDYANSLADITIGYMGARLGWQWVLVRTERGQAMLDLIKPQLEFRELDSAGDRNRGMPRYIRMLAEPPGKPPKPIRRLIAFLQRRRGPRGLEFARAVIEMKLLRNLQYLRSHFPRFEQRVVHPAVYQTLAPYAGDYAETFGRPLEPEK
ncbi:Coenzyme F420 hydrogenase/dehydrogenase, beta subunit C-terminal domain [Thiorhodovibrio frisius]|uniref:Coenzyme F420-reducing hydrogenase, beta subunit n=1 Tax=Thiorhodovibrio frisius TaxID=631362 RepID=H8Z6T1_9GAMM|nr:Coenzyme F420 hydrogenase/dehydrogenase, beta subunit C-terminal domain [Thiorhodovibrio frisius]EIC20797.1 coenzyme F420-reducing hydrogenase, beta subunit [Thiorhodovibrio frisius]WPL21848.1 coenzyme F420-reducing hydrogenase subunit beta [Thiorhodovibrio frisius]